MKTLSLNSVCNVRKINKSQAVFPDGGIFYRPADRKTAAGMQG